VAEAKQRIPANLKGTSFYSSFDLWQYIAIMDDRTCKRCQIFDRMINPGDYLRAYYPNSEIISPNQILVHEHPNCRCTLLRVSDLTDYIHYTEPDDYPSVKYKEPNLLPKKKPIAPDYIKGASRSVSLDDLGITLTEKQKRAREK